MRYTTIKRIASTAILAALATSAFSPVVTMGADTTSQQVTEEIFTSSDDVESNDVESSESVEVPKDKPEHTRAGASHELSQLVESAQDTIEYMKSLKIKKVNYKRYTTTRLNVRTQPNTDSTILGTLEEGDRIKVIGKVKGTDFVQIKYKKKNAYVCKDYLSEEKPQPSVETYLWSGTKINRSNGTVSGPSGKETYYNLPMGGVIRIMRDRGYSESEYPYWVNESGCKCLGSYIMIAADTSRYPKGTIMPTTLGMGIVADHCASAASYSGTWIDLAVTW